MKSISRSRVLVTGAGGFIGSHLCEICLSAGAQVRALVHYNSLNDWGMLEDLGGKRLDSIEVVAGDLRDAGFVRRAVRGCDRVFHLGALIGIPYSYSNPGDVVQTNVLGTFNILQSCLDSGVGRVVHTSTSEVYGTAQYVPMDENHPLNPQSPYAATKIAGDKLAESYYRTFGLPVVILRPFNTYGPRQSPRAVIPTIILQALKSKTVRLGSLAPRRDLTFVKDTARGFLAAATVSGIEGLTIQLGSQKEVSVGDLVALVGEILNKKLKVIPDSGRYRPEKSEVQRLYASNRNAKERLDWRPEVTLENGIERTIRWFRDRADRYKEKIYHI
jgi:NAD dependent epimerase/dehydratase